MSSSSNLTDGIQRLVHLDLKGAPPKPSYFGKLFSLIKSWGATGILIEYEDMFPYSGILQDLKCAEAYRDDEISLVIEAARNNQLEVIPLVQTFGHMEFVLKHDKFRHLRETCQYPNSICPSLEESRTIVKEMIDQMVGAHPDLKWIHLGADEVWQIGLCEHCVKRMGANGWNVQHLFLDHVVHIAKYAKGKYPQVGLIIWDDMLRNSSPEMLKESEIGSLVELMVWSYGSKDLMLKDGMWETLSSVFDSVWIASAFKGATGVNQMIPDLNHHMDNHRLWLSEIPKMLRSFKRLTGWALTGWQRYDHFSVLCELLPVGLRSLAVCLSTIVSVPSPPEQISPSDWEIMCVVQLLAHVKSRYASFLRHNSLTGWFSAYHRKHGYGNPAHLEVLLTEAKSILAELNERKTNLEVILSEVFYEKSVNEWLIENTTCEADYLTDIIAQLEGVISKS